MRTFRVTSTVAVSDEEGERLARRRRRLLRERCAPRGLGAAALHLSLFVFSTLFLSAGPFGFPDSAASGPPSFESGGSPVTPSAGLVTTSESEATGVGEAAGSTRSEGLGCGSCVDCDGSAGSGVTGCGTAACVATSSVDCCAAGAGSVRSATSGSGTWTPHSWDPDLWTPDFWTPALTGPGGTNVAALHSLVRRSTSSGRTAPAFKAGGAGRGHEKPPALGVMQSMEAGA